MAATAQLAPTPVFSAFTATGAPLVGGQLFTLAAGTNTLQASYIDSTLTTQNTNPVILNSLGFANVWLNPALAYKFILKDAAGNTIWTVDNIQGALSAPNVVLGPAGSGFALQVNGTAGVNNFTALIQAPVAAGQSCGLLIQAGTNANDGPLSITAASGFFLAKVSGTGGFSIGGGLTDQGIGTVNVTNGYYTNNVKQPAFGATLAGFGVPVGNLVITNYNGATATLVQTSQTVSQILLTLKAAGIYAT